MEKKKIFTEKESHDPSLSFYRAQDPEIIQKSGMEMHCILITKNGLHKKIIIMLQDMLILEIIILVDQRAHIQNMYLDDMLDGFHWYLSFMKFGMGRCSRDVQTDIRRNHITRSEGVKLVNKFDGEFPSKYFKWFLNYTMITEEFFWEVMDFYRNLSNVWKYKDGKWELTHIVS